MFSRIYYYPGLALLPLDFLLFADVLPYYIKGQLIDVWGLYTMRVYWGAICPRGFQNHLGSACLGVLLSSFSCVGSSRVSQVGIAVCAFKIPLISFLSFLDFICAHLCFSGFPATHHFAQFAPLNLTVVEHV